MVKDPQQRVAILLTSLGGEVSSAVLDSLPPTQTEPLRARLDEFKQHPPSEREKDEVLGEFERFLRFVQQSDQPTIRIADIDADQAPDYENRQGSASGDQDAGNEQSETRQSYGSVFQELAALEPAQVCGAVQGEHPRTIAMVLSVMDSERAGPILNLLEPDVRNQVFVQLGQGKIGSDQLIERIVTTVVEKGRRLSPEVKEDGEAFKRMAAMLRVLDKAQRTELLDNLEATDPEMAAGVKDVLYTFEDILQIEDRSLQQLLAEIDSATLATALKDGDPTIHDKVMGNLSRRARETLAEEIEFMGNVNAAKREEAQKSITDVIAQRDQAGELVMIE